jgi:LPXTG-motif cell wall-anchored protein
MKNPSRLGWVLLISVVFLVMATHDLQAQCVMCKAVAEESADSGGSGRGLNTAILYLMAVPYVLLGILGGVLFWKRRKS